jgi:cold shock CspA family protein
MEGPSIMAEISLWSAAIIVMLMMFAASIGFVAAAILAGARSNNDIEESKQIQGTFARWSRDKRFGFIDGDDNQEHFVHNSAFKKIGMRPPEPGDRLAFTLERGAKGSRTVGLSYVTAPSDVEQDEAALIFSNPTDYQRRPGAQRKAVDRVS